MRRKGPSFFDVLRSTMTVERTKQVREAAPVEAPVPSGPPADLPVPQPVSAERVLRIPLTTAVFGLLAGLILLLGAFYAGLRVGKTSAAERAPATEPRTEPASEAWTILLLEWPAGTRAERQTAEYSAGKIAEFLRANGFPGAQWRVEQGKVRLLYGSYPSPDSEAARQSLDALRKLLYPAEGRPGRAIFRAADLIPAGGK